MIVYLAWNSEIAYLHGSLKKENVYCAHAGTFHLGTLLLVADDMLGSLLSLNERLRHETVTCQSEGHWCGNPRQELQFCMDRAKEGS